MQIFRGPTNAASVIGAHSLLEDMYGNEYVMRQRVDVGRASVAAANCHSWSTSR